MEINNKSLNIFKLVGLIFIGIVFVFTPLTASLINNKINAVYADSNDIVNEQVEDKINKLDKKVYYEGSIEDDFADDTVIIVLNEEETHKFKTYTPEDFPEIDCVAVKDLTSHAVDYVKQEIQNRIEGKEPKKIKRINIANFRRILSLKLGEKSKENVIKAIKKLEKREELVSTSTILQFAN